MAFTNLAAWKADNPHLFLALEAVLPNRTLRLTAGGVVVLNGQTFVPEDDDIGIWTFIETLEDGEADSAVAPDIGFACATDDGVVELQEAQDARWSIQYGVLNPDTGAVLDTGGQWDCGFFNVASFAPGSRRVRYSSWTDEQFQLLDDPQIRLNPAHHRSVWPGANERGLDGVTDITKKSYWLAREPARSVSFGGGGGGANGDGGFLSRY